MHGNGRLPPLPPDADDSADLCMLLTLHACVVTDTINATSLRQCKALWDCRRKAHTHALMGAYNGHRALVLRASTLTSLTHRHTNAQQSRAHPMPSRWQLLNHRQGI